MDKLSIIIPAFNAEKYLKEAVESAAGQCPGLEKEIIIIDDGSKDHTADIAAGLADRLIRKNRGGAASARNAGFSEASGDLVLFLDADDVMTPGSIELLYKAMKDGADAVFAKAEDFISEELSIEEAAQLAPRGDAYFGGLAGCALIRKEVFDRIGLFDAALSSGETVDWMLRLQGSGAKIVRLDSVTLKRRLHLSNTSRVSKEQEMKNYAKLLRERMMRKA